MSSVQFNIQFGTFSHACSYFEDQIFKDFRFISYMLTTVFNFCVKTRHCQQYVRGWTDIDWTENWKLINKQRAQKLIKDKYTTNGALLTEYCFIKIFGLFSWILLKVWYLFSTHNSNQLFYSHKDRILNENEPRILNVSFNTNKWKSFMFHVHAKQILVNTIFTINSLNRHN